MTRPHDNLFHINFGVTKPRKCLGLCILKRRFQLRFLKDQTHSLTAAASRRFEHDGIADLTGRYLGFFKRPKRFGRSRHDRHTGLDRDLASRHLAAQPFHRLGRRADKCDPGLGHFANKIRIFRQKPVTRMYRVDASRFCNLDDLFPPQIALVRRRRPNMKRLIRHPHVQSVPVHIRINRHGRDLHLTTGADDSASDLSTISN